MSETNQNQNSISQDFDDELNDVLIRSYLLQKVGNNLIEKQTYNAGTSVLLTNVMNEIEHLDAFVIEALKEDEEPNV